MDRFVSTYINKIDAKGRVSVPAPFRTILERDGYAGGIYCYPSLDAPALDAGGKRLAENIDRILDGLPDYSDERDELSVALYGDVHIIAIDQDGRIVLPEALRAHAGLDTHVAFVGLGQKFQMWEPKRFEERRAQARQKVQSHRRLFGDLKRIKAPTLVIHGKADKLIRPSGGRATASAIPGAKLDVIDGMGHDLPREVWPRILDGIEQTAARAEQPVAQPAG